MKIGELAKMSGCQVVTIRYYEKEGLLPKPDRTGSNYRLYGKEDVERLRFIRHCRRHGMTLSEIRELLAFKDNPRADCGWINTLVETHLADVAEQIDSLTHLKSDLEQLLHKCSGGNTGECGILESLSHEDSCPYCEDLRCHRKEQDSQKTKKPMEIKVR